MGRLDNRLMKLHGGFDQLIQVHGEMQFHIYIQYKIS